MSLHPTTNSATTDRPPGESPASVWAWGALAVALAGMAGSLFLGLGMDLKACPLCFYQRSFAMSLVAVLGLLAGVARPGRVALLGLPLAVGGLGVALFHVSLELVGRLECPAGVFGLGTSPQQSPAVFLALTGLLAAGSWQESGAGAVPWAALAGGISLGMLPAVASTVANPPPPPAPTRPYEKPPDICRPPYRAPGG
jgi:disulfide bond formation protein DsbB